MTNQIHYVTFLSPGTFCSETTVREVESWDVNAAVDMSRTIIERHGAKPFGFIFTTEEFDSNCNRREVKRSGCHYLGGRLLSLSQIEARNDHNDSILISNMKSNGYDTVIENTNSLKSVLPFRDGDILINYR
jgi:hypothetical protein